MRSLQRFIEPKRRQQEFINSRLDKFGLGILTSPMRLQCVMITTVV